MLHHASLPPRVLAYDPTRAAFTEAPAPNPRTAFACGLEVWARDLLSVLDFDAGWPDVFFLGRKRLWNLAPARLSVDLDTELMLFTHPVRRPEGWGRLYARYRGPVATLPPAVVPAGDAVARVRVQGPWPAPPPTPEAPAPDAAHDAGAPGGATSGAPASTPLSTPALDRLSEATETATGGAWVLAAAGRVDDAEVRLELVAPQGRLAVVLWRGDGGGRPCYQEVEGMSAAYEGQHLDGEDLGRLDRLLASVAGPLAALLAAGAPRR